MKRICEMGVAVCCILFQLKGSAQPHNGIFKVISLDPYHLSVGFNKTTNLVFPCAIKSVDKGSEAILAQKAKGIENILQLKAARRQFSETSISVVTSDGKFYSFALNYADEPAILNLSITSDSLQPEFMAVFSGQPRNEGEMALLTKRVMRQKNFLYRSTSNQLMQLLLRGIYLNNNLMWFKLQFANRSLINFKPADIRFFVRDKARIKRTTIQETELQALYDSGSDVIEGNDKGLAAYCFKPFTIAKGQELIIQVTEEEGGRSLQLRIKGKVILKAKHLCE